MNSIKDFNNANPTDKMATNKSIFIWLDILGFSEAVDDGKQYEKLSEHLMRFQTIFNSGEGYHANIISDGIILYIQNPEFEKTNNIFRDIGQKQFQFICETNQFIRGGIAVGTRWQGKKQSDCNNIYISNGLARAVKIESKSISWPIIGVDKQNLLEIQKMFDMNNPDDFIGFVHGFNQYGGDVYFIDFISEDERYCNLLEAKINEFSTDKKEHIRNKYIWLLRYYLQKFNKPNTISALQGAIL